MALIVKNSTAEDVPVLEQLLPITDSRLPHVDRFRMQEEGLADYLLAWDHDLLVGHVFIRWTGFKFGDLPNLYPNAPVVRSLRVTKEGKGIGTALMDAVDARAKAKGFARIGLGVEIENERAIRLYERLGWQDWGNGVLTEHITKLDENGNKYAYEEVFTVMLKALG